MTKPLAHFAPFFKILNFAALILSVSTASADSREKTPPLTAKETRAIKHSVEDVTPALQNLNMQTGISPMDSDPCDDGKVSGLADPELFPDAEILEDYRVNSSAFDKDEVLITLQKRHESKSSPWISSKKDPKKGEINEFEGMTFVGLDKKTRTAIFAKVDDKKEVKFFKIRGYFGVAKSQPPDEDNSTTDKVLGLLSSLTAAAKANPSYGWPTHARVEFETNEGEALQERIKLRLNEIEREREEQDKFKEEIYAENGGSSKGIFDQYGLYGVFSDADSTKLYDSETHEQILELKRTEAVTRLNGHDPEQIKKIEKYLKEDNRLEDYNGKTIRYETLPNEGGWLFRFEGNDDIMVMDPSGSSHRIDFNSH